MGRLLWAVGVVGAVGGVLLWVAGCGGGGGTAPGNTWGVLVYMSGDNDLESALIGDFNELERIGGSGFVDALVQFDRHPSFDASNGNWTTTRRYRIERDISDNSGPPNTPHNLTITSPMLSDLGELNMGDADTLVDFATWGIDTIQADRYLLILADHGAGWRPASVGSLGVSARGVIRDDTSAGDWLTNAELKSALAAIKAHLGRNLDVLALDASEMSLLEIAYQVRASCDYVLASALSEPNDGYPMDAIMYRLTNHPNITPEPFCDQFVTDYVDSYLPGSGVTGAGSSVTMAAYRESQVGALATAVSQFAVLLRAKLPGDAVNLRNIRTATQRYDSLSYRDLWDFADRVAAFFLDAQLDQAAAAVRDATGPGANTALVAEGHQSGAGVNVDDAHGIAIYLPADATTYDATYATVVDFAPDTQWDEYISDTSGLP